MTLIQWISFVVIFVISVMEIRWMMFNKKKAYLAIPTLIWMIHGIVFYLSILLFVPEPGEYTMWSSILRLHGYLTMMFHSFYRMNQGYV